jgi:protein involved in polysaccharide export with SLBB domain
MKDRGTFDLTEGQDLKSASTPTTIIQPPGVALEGPVDPEEYYVGPSDVLAVNVWISPPVSFTLTVTPEGTLIVPTVGEVKVSDLTLAEAKRKTVGEIKKKYISGEPTVTLISPRPIIVSVTGNVLNPGSYALTAVDRADKAIEAANRATRTQSQSDIDRILYDMSTRNVVLRRRDGTSTNVDIAKFLSNKAGRLNPYLREGDVVVATRKNLVKNVIGVYGEVNVPGRYEYVRGDSLKDAILLAQGFTRLALSDSVEFSRLDLMGQETTTRIVNANRIVAQLDPDFPLEPGDRVVVRPRPDLREDYRASIVGEVLYPGTYPITKNKTRLSELIKMAGRFTEFASLKNAELNRRSVNPEQVELERLLSLRGSVSPEDSAYYYLETELRIRKEIVTVDFERLMLQGDSTQNVILQTDDYVVVPSVRKTIYVFGQVVSPGHIPYVKGETKDYYINKAGGYTERARPGDLRVIKSKTKQWLDYRETTIEEGDYIWVPKEPERTFSYYMTVLSQAATVMSVVVGVAAVVISVSR